MYRFSNQEYIAERRDAIRRAADVLADSGLLDGWEAIQRALLSRYGLSELQCYFASPISRELLNQRCAAARLRPKG